ncbi:MAG: tyrosine-type recombinase/integrase, partial [Chloroflexota bacterium]|nr:tyrosine-type recombinase/integrase [Chloroflexota bacterium]
MTALLDDFIIYLQAQDRSPHTVTAYRRDVVGFFAWVEQQVCQTVPPVAITSFDVQKYRDALVSLGRKPATINRKLAALRVFFDWASREEHASTNPATDIHGIRQQRHPPKALSEQEVYRLQREAAAQRQLAKAQYADTAAPTVVYTYRDEALLNLLLYTGLRVAEAAALKLEDVVLHDRSGKVIVRSGKGRKYREIPLHKEARKTLKAYLEVRLARTTGKGDSGGRSLFLGQRGPLGSRGIQLRLAALAEAAGVEGVTPHVLRHTFATRLLREVKT